MEESTITLILACICCGLSTILVCIMLIHFAFNRRMLKKLYKELRKKNEVLQNVAAKSVTILNNFFFSGMYQCY